MAERRGCIRGRSLTRPEIDEQKQQEDEQKQQEIESHFKNHFGELVGVFTSVLRDAETAADIVQQTFADFVRVSDNQEIGNPRALLFDIGWKRVVSHFRREEVRRKYATEVERRLYGGPGFFAAGSPEDAALNGERLQALDRIIVGLPRRRRRVLVLHLLHGMSLEDIAATEGIMERSARKQLERAIADCRKALRRLFGAKVNGQSSRKVNDTVGSSG